VLGRTPDALGSAIADEPQRRRGRPPGSTNKPKEMTVNDSTPNVSPETSITWWVPVVRSGGREPVVRIDSNGKISISKSVFDLLGFDPHENNRFRMGSSSTNALVIQFAQDPDPSPKDYPWRLNRDRSVWTRPVEKLAEIKLPAGRYWVKTDMGRRLLVVSLSDRLPSGAKT